MQPALSSIRTRVAVFIPNDDNNNTKDTSLYDVGYSFLMFCESRLCICL